MTQADAVMTADFDAHHSHMLSSGNKPQPYAKNHCHLSQIEMFLKTAFSQLKDMEKAHHELSQRVSGRALKEDKLWLILELEQCNQNGV